MVGRINTKLMVPEPRIVRLEQAPVAEPGQCQILIRNDYTVMNLGTEMTIFSGDFPAGSWWDQHIRYPDWAGWGCLGEVVAVGEGVTEFQPGDRVVGDGPHGRYYLARLDRPDAPQHVPPGMQDEHAGLWSLSRVALHGVRVATIDVGEAIVVLGQGIVGQLALRFAELAGAFPLIAVDMSAMRLDLARQGGATHTLQGPIDTLLDDIRSLNKGRKVDCVLEVTGNPVAIPHALKLPRMRGRVIILGSPRGVSQVDFHDQIHFGVDVRGAQWSTYPQVESHINPWTYARNGELFLDLVHAGRLNVDGLISHTFNWREALDVYQEIYEERTRFMAVRYDWRDCPE
jgi:2-desacetyl-2-hydroxyethyl bacteriochlorophyllide A dehydrogenase